MSLRGAWIGFTFLLLLEVQKIGSRVQKSFKPEKMDHTVIIVLKKAHTVFYIGLLTRMANKI